MSDEPNYDEVEDEPTRIAPLPMRPPSGQPGPEPDDLEDLQTNKVRIEDLGDIDTTTTQLPVEDAEESVSIAISMADSMSISTAVQEADLPSPPSETGKGRGLGMLPLILALAGVLLVGGTAFFVVRSMRSQPSPENEGTAVADADADLVADGKDDPQDEEEETETEGKPPRTARELEVQVTDTDEPMQMVRLVLGDPEPAPGKGCLDPRTEFSRKKTRTIAGCVEFAKSRRRKVVLRFRKNGETKRRRAVKSPVAKRYQTRAFLNLRSQKHVVGDWEIVVEVNGEEVAARPFTITK
jgi:hypothetical protein